MGLPAKQLVLERAGGGGLVSCKALAAGRGSCHLKENALSFYKVPNLRTLMVAAGREKEDYIVLVTSYGFLLYISKICKLSFNIDIYLKFMVLMFVKY